MPTTRLLIRADDGDDLPAYMAAWRTRYRSKGKVKILVDINPQSFF